jgi:hypothetical protein
VVSCSTQRLVLSSALNFQHISGHDPAHLTTCAKLQALATLLNMNHYFLGVNGFVNTGDCIKQVIVVVKFLSLIYVQL